MATSFAAYASQYLNRRNQDESALSSSQPMFFSFTTDNESRAGHDTDLDDLDDPHIRESEVSRTARHNQDDDDDPYLRLDEEEHTSRGGFDSKQNNGHRAPLLRSDDASSVSSSPRGGWLAHLVSSPPRPLRASSPSRSNSTDSGPPPDLFTPPAPQARVQPPPATTSRQPASLALTESLLPRDGHARPIDVFHLPDPRHTPRSRRKYNDSIWTALWLTGVSICYFFSILLLFLAKKPPGETKGLPYTTLLHTVPMLTILTILSALVAYTHIFLLRIFVRPVMIGTSVFIPATLFISAIWAFVGSFMWDSGQEPTWGETVGLRLFSLVPLALSILTARRLVHLPRDIHVTSSTLTLTTHLLIGNPFLLALSPAILLIALIGSIPFLTLIFRLLLSGHGTPPSKDSPAWEWHVYGWANWAIFGAVGAWLWSWGVARGILRMTCASVIGAWYFANPDVLPPPPMSTHTIHAALVRSTGPSLGTVSLSALILTVIRLLTLLTLFLGRLPAYIPPRAFFLVNGIRLAVGYLDGVTTSLSKYALVYAGLTGDPFMPSARRARALTASVEAKVKQGRKKFGAEPPLTLLTVAPLTLSFPFALLTYLFVAHTLDAPYQALGAAVLAGGVTALVGLFCVGLVKDTADTLYVCYCIDKDVGERRREEVFVTFEYESRNQIPSRTRQNRLQPALSREPEEIVPLSPRSPPHRQTQPLVHAQHSPQRVSQQRQQQSQSTSSHPESQVLKQQLMQTAPVANPPKGLASVHRPKPLSPNPQIAIDADDLDPFRNSFAEEHADPPRSPSPPQQVRRMTSAEMNMKSHVFDPKKRAQLYDDSSDEDEGGGLGQPSELQGSEGQGERSQRSSQFFPGSDFF